MAEACICADDCVGHAYSLHVIAIFRLQAKCWELMADWAASRPSDHFSHGYWNRAAATDCLHLTGLHVVMSVIFLCSSWLAHTGGGLGSGCWWPQPAQRQVWVDKLAQGVLL